MGEVERIADRASIQVSFAHNGKDRTSVFLGPSGVGKSSLLAALEPALENAA